MTRQEKEVNHLFKDLIKSMGVKKGDIIKKEQFFNWFAKNHPEIKRDAISTYLLKVSTDEPNCLNYKIRFDDEDDLLYQVDSQSFLYDSGKKSVSVKRDPSTRGNKRPAEKKVMAFVDKDPSVFNFSMKLYR